MAQKYASTKTWLMTLDWCEVVVEKYRSISFDLVSWTGLLWNLGNPPDIHLKLKSREIAFFHNTRFNCSIGLNFCTKHGSDTAVLCAKIQTDWSTGFALLDGYPILDKAAGLLSYPRKGVVIVGSGSWLVSSNKKQLLMMYDDLDLWGHAVSLTENYMTQKTYQ